MCTVGFFVAQDLQFVASNTLPFSCLWTTESDHMLFKSWSHKILGDYLCWIIHHGNPHHLNQAFLLHFAQEINFHVRVASLSVRASIVSNVLCAHVVDVK